MHEPFLPRKQLYQSLICHSNIFRISRKSHPTKGTSPFTKLRTNIGRDKSRYFKGIPDSRLLRLCPYIVAVIEDDHSPFLKLKHGFYMLPHTFISTGNIHSRIFQPEFKRALKRMPHWNISIQ